ncbi:MAG: PDGLE domain-containing protein, partial [Alphaproteobacteria bacterium]
VTGSAEIAEPAPRIHSAAAYLQEKTALLPDYDFPVADAHSSSEAGAASQASAEAESETAWGAPNIGTSVSGLIGGMMTLALAMLLGWTFRRRMPEAAT